MDDSSIVPGGVGVEACALPATGPVDYDVRGTGGVVSRRGQFARIHAIPRHLPIRLAFRV